MKCKCVTCEKEMNWLVQTTDGNKETTQWMFAVYYCCSNKIWVTSALQKVKLRWKDFILQPQITNIFHSWRRESYKFILNIQFFRYDCGSAQFLLLLLKAISPLTRGNPQWKNPRGNWKKALWQPNPLSLMVTIFPLLLFFIWILQMKLLNNVTEPFNVLTFCLQQHAWFCSRIIWERQIVLLC